MNAKKPASRRCLTSDLARVDAHTVTAEEYEELAEVTDEMLERAKLNKGGKAVLTESPQIDLTATAC